jgi:hypothetical protein
MLNVFRVFKSVLNRLFQEKTDEQTGRKIVKSSLARIRNRS